MKKDLKNFSSFVAVLGLISVLFWGFDGFEVFFWSVGAAVICAGITGIICVSAFYAIFLLVAAFIEGPVKAWREFNPAACARILLSPDTPGQK